MIRAEQGFGDSIQFIRYASIIAERGGIAVVECQPALASLFRAAKGVAEVAPMGSSRPAFDLQVPMLSLPLVCGTTLETIPAAVPYLTVDAARQGTWRARLGSDHSRVRVGLAWKGSEANRGNPLRSIPLDLLAPLFDLEGVEFFSLQKSTGAEHGPHGRDGRHELFPLQKSTGSEPVAALPAALIDHSADLHDFADTAALIGELDLVISIDSAVLHLAGALGRRAWGLLRFAADWRYLQRREDSPWYPTLRLFRQPRHRDWEPVVAAVRRELAGWLAER